MKNSETYIPEQKGAIPAYHLIKIELLDTQFKAKNALAEYRIRPKTSYLNLFATNVVDLYTQLRPKLKNCRKRKYEEELDGISSYYFHSKFSSKMNRTQKNELMGKFLRWFLVLQDALEEIGVTSLMVEGEEGDPETILQEGWVGGRT